ncbi:hypothetical protein BDZ91DRAFT_717090 [Kalaharituber pfeilii]|nr:hypothetical protein BDZ91DRAFT_717090 [Kalaharituber pfeilii]
MRCTMHRLEVIMLIDYSSTPSTRLSMPSTTLWRSLSCLIIAWSSGKMASILVWSALKAFVICCAVPGWFSILRALLQL